MAISQLLRDSIFARLFGGDSGRGALIVSMTSVKLGDRLLVVGLSDPSLLATLAGKIGITGRACGVDPSADLVDRAERAARKAGVLVETQRGPFTDLPAEPDGFDVVVVRARGELAREEALGAALGAARRVLRDGGRCLVLADAAPGNRLAWWRKVEPAPPAPRIAQLFEAHGYRAARVRAEREALAFVESVSRLRERPAG
jgi:ubiquinone/menaquinone biosynthesis C-methylase UbiE